MALYKLPSELRLDVLSYLPRRDLVSLCSTCKYLRALVMPILYKAIISNNHATAIYLFTQLTKRRKGDILVQCAQLTVSIVICIDWVDSSPYTLVVLLARKLEICIRKGYFPALQEFHWLYPLSPGTYSGQHPTWPSSLDLPLFRAVLTTYSHR